MKPQMGAPCCKIPVLSVIFITVTFFYQGLSSTYYVDNSGTYGCGNYSNYGSELNPWCTITYAVSQINAGDTVYVKSGTYNENLYISGLSGTSENISMIIAYPNHTVTIKGNGINTGRVKITGCNYLTFSGFSITNFNQALFIEGESTNITVKNCKIFYIGQEGIHVKENCSYVTIDSNTIYDTDQYIHNGEGIYIGTGSAGPVDNTHNITVSNNTIYNVGDEAIELKPGTHDCIIEGNHVYNVVISSNYGVIEASEAVLGVQSWNSNPNHLIRNNIIHDVITGIRAGTGCTVYNNIIYNADRGIYVNNSANDSYTRIIYHNTIDVNSSNAVYIVSGATDIKNNIGPSSVNNIASDNSYYISTIEGEEDYHLKKDAAPVNIGLDLTSTVKFDIDGQSRPFGSAPDYGADEYSPLVPPRKLKFLKE